MPEVPQPPPGDPIKIEVQTEKVENVVDLETVLQSIAQGAEAAAGTTGAQKPAPDVAKRLQNLSKLARDLSGEMTRVRKMDPRIEERIRARRTRQPPMAFGMRPPEEGDDEPPDNPKPRGRNR